MPTILDAAGVAIPDTVDGSRMQGRAADMAQTVDFRAWTAPGGNDRWRQLCLSGRPAVARISTRKESTDGKRKFDLKISLRNNRRKQGKGDPWMLAASFIKPH